MSLVHMAHTSIATAAAVAQVDIQADGIITGVEWTGGVVPSGSNIGNLKQELSFGSTAAETVNDSRQIISTANLPATPSDAAGLNKFTPMNLNVQAGERIYIHSTLQGSAPTSSKISCIIHLEDKANRTTLRRR